MDTADLEHVTEQRRARQQRRHARNSEELSALLAHRGELSGVSPVADFVVESVRWSA